MAPGRIPVHERSRIGAGISFQVLVPDHVAQEGMEDFYGPVRGREVVLYASQRDSGHPADQIDAGSTARSGAYRHRRHASPHHQARRPVVRQGIRNFFQIGQQVYAIGAGRQRFAHVGKGIDSLDARLDRNLRRPAPDFLTGAGMDDIQHSVSIEDIE